MLLKEGNLNNYLSNTRVKDDEELEELNAKKE